MLMMIFMRYQRQENGESQEDEIVGIEEHAELECFPIHSEVVACVRVPVLQYVVLNKSWVDPQTCDRSCAIGFEGFLI
jgi:hypothetical protein